MEKDYEVGKVSTSDSSKDQSEGRATQDLSSDVDVEPGGSATLHFNVPASAKGTWQFGCFEAGHYDAGMKGTLVID